MILCMFSNIGEYKKKLNGIDINVCDFISIFNVKWLKQLEDNDLQRKYDGMNA